MLFKKYRFVDVVQRYLSMHWAFSFDGSECSLSVRDCKKSGDVVAGQSTK